MRYLLDTSAIISGFKAENILIPRPAISELYYFAEKRIEKGIIGLKNLKELVKNYNVEFVGDYTKEYETIDIQIIELAKLHNCILVTKDKSQALLAESLGVSVKLLEYKTKEFIFKEFWDKDTLSIHMKEDCKIIAKKGKPGEVYIERYDKVLSKGELEEEIEKILEVGNVEKESEGLLIVQYQDYRILITTPPLSNRVEITVVKPLITRTIEDYQLKDKLKERLRVAEGLLIAGRPGEGKSTFARALAEFYRKMDKIVKTIESPRDLKLNPEITQYLNRKEVIDILLLARPDYTIFDEIRNPEDFKLFTELRLAGVGMVGVIHASKPIESIQRFIGKLELGMIPHVIDTVIFIEKGEVSKILSLEMTVKVPFGMTEDDLARPVILVKDFVTGDVLYEIFKFGEETCVVETDVSKKLEDIKKIVPDCEIKKLEDRIILKCSRSTINKLLANKGRLIKRLEKIVKLPIELVPKEKFEVIDAGDNIIILTPYKKKKVRVFVNGHEVGVFKTKKDGRLKIPKFEGEIDILPY